MLALACACAPTLADVANERKQAAGMVFYMGIVPAAIVQSHPPGHPERAMHGGVPSGSSQYHVMVAIFDAKTGRRIPDAEVRARVESVGLGGEEKALEPMPIANLMTYGNFFDMSGKGAFRIVLHVRRPGAPRIVDVQFDHRHR
jgi:hypothetical protein